jgi:murein L,D-transpeptidase YafK
VGLYFITSSLDPRSLKDLYGSGALPINYPNAYDQRRGKTGSGIWLHGTPSAQFSRAPWATDGCVAVANPDLNHIISTVQIRTTPVLIADRLDWVPQQAVAPQRSQLGALLNSWTLAKSRGDIDALMSLYAPDFQAEGRSLAAHREWLQADVTRARGRGVRIDDASILAWGNGVDVRVITFAEFVGNARAGRIVRQYWERQGGSWKIVYEGVLG